MNELRSNSPSLGTVLDLAMSLPLDDQRKLTDAMVAITGVPVADDMDSGATSRPELTVQEWLHSISEQKPWDRLQLIHSALQEEILEEDEAALQTARKELLSDHPQLAIRHTVRRIASEHPLALILGTLGLGLAIMALGRGLFRVVF